jgi:hypothetical protein
MLKISMIAITTLLTATTPTLAQDPPRFFDGFLEANNDREMIYHQDLENSEYRQQTRVNNLSNLPVSVRVKSNTPFSINGRFYNNSPANIRIPGNSAVKIEYKPTNDIYEVIVETELIDYGH